jgi:hypothetical protein
VGAPLRVRIQEPICGVLAQKSSIHEEKQNTSIGGETYGGSILDAADVINVDFLEPGTTIISDRYIATLVTLKQRLKRIGRKKEKVSLQCDNTRLHASSATVEG